MSNPKFISFAESGIDFIDGDRGTNYPSKSELIANGYCVFLNTGNVKKTGFDFTQVEFIDEEKDKKLRKGKVRQGDIVLTTRGTVGNVALVTSDTPFKNIRINSGMVIVRTDPEKYDPYFILLFFRSSLFQKQCLSHGSGSAQPQLPISALKYISFPNIDIGHQRKVVSAASCIDKKIELNNRISAELESMAKTLYDYWFVQFDFPDNLGRPYKSSGGKMVYNPTLKCEVPEGWEVTTVGKISKTELGGTPSTSVDEYWKDADIPWLSSAETASFPVITSEQKVTLKGITNSAASILPKGTVVISIVRYIRPSILGIDAATNQSVVGIRECSRLKSSFIYPYFCSEVPRLMGLRTGAQQPHINKGVVENSPIVIPCERVLTDYYKIADPIFEKIMNLAFQSHELMQLRDWLLPMLMNGQVTVGGGKLKC